MSNFFDQLIEFFQSDVQREVSRAVSIYTDMLEKQDKSERWKLFDTFQKAMLSHFGYESRALIAFTNYTASIDGFFFDTLPQVPDLHDPEARRLFLIRLRSIQDNPASKRLVQVCHFLFDAFAIIAPRGEGATALHTPLLDMIDEATITRFYHYLAAHPPLQETWQQYQQNRAFVNLRVKAKELQPGTRQYYRALTDNLLFSNVFFETVPVFMPDAARFEHAWILAPQGTGKTQLIQHLFLRDLPKVAENQASVIVMDSQGDMLNILKRLKCFAPGGNLHGKLVVIEPDITHPLALNPFSIGRGRLDTYSPRDREQLSNSALELLTYVFSALGEGASFTPKQATLYRYCLRLLMQIPGASLNTFVDILNNGITSYAQHINQLDQTARSFFQHQFNDTKQFGQTRQEVAWRSMLMLENTAFNRMFNAPDCRFDMFTELSSAKVILINTDKALLGEERTALFGRFFIALLLAATQERATLERTGRLPVFAYIDEAADYIRNDQKITSILDQARKMNIGLTLANQRSAQITSANVLDALRTTSIKFAHTDNVDDANMLAKAMHCPADFIARQPERHFALHIRGVTERALSVAIPFFAAENMEKMEEAQWQAIAAQMRERYAVRHQEPKPREEPTQEPPPDHITPGPW